MERLKQSWFNRVPAAVRKPLILIIGITVLIAGAAMLVLPGPGIVVIFIGLALLATEFTLAARLRDWSIHKVKGGVDRIKRKQ